MNKHTELLLCPWSFVDFSWNAAATLRYADDTTLNAESEEELMSHLMKVKEESEKVGLKINIQKTKIMASGPTTSWEIDGEAVETVSDFIFWGSKITADGDCSHEIKRCLLLGRKVMTNLDSIFKSRHITLPTNIALTTLATLLKELTHWKRLWCWEGLGAGGKGDDRGWDGWMASPSQWMWVWMNSGRWWWTGRPGVLWSMGLQRVRHDWTTELNWTELRSLSLSLWNSSGQNTEVGSLSLLQGIFPTQESNSGLPHCRWILYQLSHKGSPFKGTKQAKNNEYKGYTIY